MASGANGLYDKPALHMTAFNAACAESGEIRANEFDNLKTLLCTGVDISLKDSDNFTALDRVREYNMDMTPCEALDSPMTDYLRVYALLELISKGLRELVHQRKLKASDEIRGRMDIPPAELKHLLRDVCATTADLNMDDMLKKVTTDLQSVFRQEAKIREITATDGDCKHKQHADKIVACFRHLADNWCCR